jgi:hypothetical protein
MNWPAFWLLIRWVSAIFANSKKSQVRQKLLMYVWFYTVTKKQKKTLFTPEKSIRVQFAIGMTLKLF